MSVKKILLKILLKIKPPKHTKYDYPALHEVYVESYDSDGHLAQHGCLPAAEVFRLGLNQDNIMPYDPIL